MVILKRTLVLRKKELTYFFCHWKEYILIAHNKISLLAIYIIQCIDIDIICIFRFHHIWGWQYSSHRKIIILLQQISWQHKKGRCLFILKKNLALRNIEIYHVTECVLCEVSIKGQVGYVIVSYHLQVKLAHCLIFIKFWETLSCCLISQIAFIIILGDFNARSKS